MTITLIIKLIFNMKKTKARKQKPVSCHNTKSAANKKQKEMKEDGKNAQIKTTKRKGKKTKYCVTSSGMSKVKKAKPKRKRRTKRK